MTTPFNLASFADKVSSTGTANPSAISDIANTSTGALGFPVGTTAQRNGTPVNGMTRINSTTSVLEVYYNGAWVTISTFTPPGPTVIGQAYGGGYYAGQISTVGNGVADYYLIVAPKATGQTSSLAFATSSGTDPDSVIAGPTNTNTMNNSTHPASQYCKGLSIGGFSDWYLPAKNELEICYYNLRPFGGTSDPNSGINPNAVPPRTSGYSSSDPATSVVIFKAGGTESFDGTRYWTSTQYSDASAFYQDFFTGAQNNLTKTVASGNNIRAVRRIPI